MDHEIITWLNSERGYHSGMLLFDRFNTTPNLGRILRIGGPTGNNRKTLIYELEKILKNLAVSYNGPALEKPLGKQEILNTDQSSPSLNPGISELKVRQKMLYKMLDNLHAILPYRELQERKNVAFQILDLDDKLKEVLERILHYEKHGVLLPEPIQVKPRDVSSLGPGELIQRQMNVRTYITRYKRLVENSKSLKTLSRNRELLVKFQLEMDDINKRLGR